MSDDKPVPWSCYVERALGEGDWVTVFAVPPQYFTLARVPADDPEGEAHCNLIRDMFITALRRAGLRDPLIGFVLNAPKATEPTTDDERKALEQFRQMKRGRAKAWLESKPDWWREAYEEAAKRDAVRIETADRTLRTCWCYNCLDEPSAGFDNPALQFMIVCPQCSNKRCPKARHHDNACTGSNEPGQKWSVYG